MKLDESRNNKVTVTFAYQYPLEKLTVSNIRMPEEIVHKNKIYQYHAEIKENITHFTISHEFQKDIATINADLKEKLVLRAIEIVNRLLTEVRTFYHLKPNFHHVSPMTISDCRIQFSEGSNILLEDTVMLKKDLPEYLELFFDMLNDNEYEDWWDVIMEDEQLPHITLLMDAYYLLNEYKYNECIINCCTALESYVFPIVINYFKDLTHSKSESIAKEIVMNISMATKYEILFGSIDNEILGHLPDLLQDLKQITSIRNAIIHSGRKGTRIEAWNSLNSTAKLFLGSFLKVDDLA